MKASNFTFGGIHYRTRFGTGDGIAVKSIQERYFRGFSIPQLLHSDHSTIPFTSSSIQFFLSFSADEKQERDRETVKLRDSVLTSRPYYSQSPVVRGIVPSQK